MPPAQRARPLRLLHVHSSFDPGGKELRSVQLINRWGAACAHSIVSAVPAAMGAAGHIARGIPVLQLNLPGLTGWPGPRKLQALAAAMRGYDLILTYNWGAMNAVLAHTVFGPALGLAPLVHHEDGFNADEAERLKPSRNAFRMLALARAQALVVPSAGLEGIALHEWKQPRERVHRIANGIDVRAYARKPRRDAMPRLVKRPGELWLGTFAGLRPVKNLPALVRAFNRLPEPWQLVIAGEGPEREAILAEAGRLGIADRVHLPGLVADPGAVIGLFDLFALSSRSEQFPISVVEAMAAGLAVASPAVGDIAAMLAPANAPFVTPPGDEAALAGALDRLAADAPLR
ncbi:MAG TPA: glycosyltransferase, partial [Novosphingobium sp.]|nr:glycosyltransferase [Novosphingobium sp.]